MSRLIGDNVFWLTWFIGSILLVATVGIILNILVRDGPDVVSELNFLYSLVGGGVAIMTLLSGWHTFLSHRRKMAGKE